MGSIHYFIDEFIVFRGIIIILGWCFHSEGEDVRLSAVVPPGQPLELEVDYLRSPDVERVYGEAAKEARFNVCIPFVQNKLFTSSELDEFKLVFMAGDETVIFDNPHTRHYSAEAFFDIYNIFQMKLSHIAQGEVLEIGSRARSNVSRRDMFHKGLNYTGFDIAAGENVDVTGDAHRLSSHFPADKFDIVCSYSVFEHLLMPWVVAVEINKVLKSGGLVMTQTHQSWPVHDEPWDYFRFSEHSWHSIFNKYSGFEILQSGMGERCFVVPSLCARQFYDLEHQLGYMSSVCLAQKISDTPLKWDANPDEIIKTVYPA